MRVTVKTATLLCFVLQTLPCQWGLCLEPKEAIISLVLAHIWCTWYMYVWAQFYWHWATLLWVTLLWAVTLLNCYLTELLLLLANSYFTELLLDWTVTLQNCYLTELLFYWTVTWLSCYLTELLLDWLFAFLNLRNSEVSQLNFLWLFLNIFIYIHIYW